MSHSYECLACAKSGDRRDDKAEVPDPPQSHMAAERPEAAAQGGRGRPQAGAEPDVEGTEKPAWVKGDAPQSSVPIKPWNL